MPLSHLSGRSGHQKLHKISREYSFNQKHLRGGAKSSTLTHVSYKTQIPGTRPSTLGDRVNFLPLTASSDRQSGIGEGFPTRRCR